jgi:hypothetical protein
MPPHNTATGTLACTGSIIESSGVHITAKPKPVSPCVKPAVNVTAHIQMMMVVVKCVDYAIASAEARGTQGTQGT